MRNTLSALKSVGFGLCPFSKESVLEVSVLESVRFGKCPSWRVSVLESVCFGECPF